MFSDSTFPKANFDYSINVRLLTSDNESISESEEIVYYYESEKFNIVTNTDSIHFNYIRNGETQPKKVIIHSEDNFGNKSQVYEGLTPCKIELNPYYANYSIESDSLSESIHLTGETSLLQCFSERTKDSIFFRFKTPVAFPSSTIFTKKQPAIIWLYRFLEHPEKINNPAKLLCVHTLPLGRNNQGGKL